MIEELPKPNEKLEAFSAAVEDFYHARKVYYKEHPDSKENDLEEMLASRGKELLQTYEPLLASLRGADKSRCLMLIGRIHNASNTYSRQAEEYLYKAAKMNPTLSEAWNALGECYYKNDQVDKALNCFQCVLKHVKDKVALRNLSKVMRCQDRIDPNNLQESIKRSQEALEIDLSDGASWFNLGNAYLTAFFYGGQPERVLRQALFCYRKALADGSQIDDPDLHFSLAEASKYTEDFQTALDSYSNAHKCNPTWSVPSEKVDNLEMYLRDVDEAVSSKGKTRPRKLELILKTIKPHHCAVFSTVKKTLRDVEWGEPPEDTNWHIVLKVVTTLSSRALAFTCCAIDENLDCVAVSVFNLDEGKAFIVGDTIVIAGPEPKHHTVTLRNDARIDFKSLRVSDPRTIAVNGRLITNKWLAPVRLRTELYNS